MKKLLWAGIVVVMGWGLDAVGMPLSRPSQLMPEVVKAPKSTPAHLVQVEAKARAITVKVASAESWGSGIIVQRQGSVYTVLTNDHVLDVEDASFEITTPDGLVYRGVRWQNVDFGDYDLGVLRFYSPDVDYEIATLNPTTPVREGETVFASGFPFTADPNEDRGFKFTIGQVSLISEQALAEGYQLGYTNEIEKGMSGGPVLNRQGEAIGINGMHAYPLWGDPYIYVNGQKPCPAMRAMMERSSWAIPMVAVFNLAPQLNLESVSTIVQKQMPELTDNFTTWLRRQRDRAQRCEMPLHPESY